MIVEPASDAGQSLSADGLRSDDRAQPPSLRTLNSADLFKGAREVLIQHDEKTYRLRVTRNGKLILVK